MALKTFNLKVFVGAFILAGLAYQVLQAIFRPRHVPTGKAPSVSTSQRKMECDNSVKIAVSFALKIQERKFKVQSTKLHNELENAKWNLNAVNLELDQAKVEIESLNGRLSMRDDEAAACAKGHQKLKSDLKKVKLNFNTTKTDLKKAQNEIKGLKSKLANCDVKSLKLKSFSGHKLVHLDLKGAPPKMTYLLELIKLFKNLGATGLLVEYEDTYPYEGEEGELRLLRSKSAYSESEVRQLIKEANTLNLTVIPLLPTFGHIEFVLKHKKFAHIREVKEMANALCPLNQDSLPLIKKLIKDILRLHPDSKWIHLGGDEVWPNFKVCPICKADNRSHAELYLHHMMPLLQYVKKKTGGRVTPIIWDDMMREWKVKDLKSIAKLAQLMIWVYVPDVENFPGIPSDMYKRFSDAFDEIWVATAFKGADKTTTNFVPIKNRVENHISWLKTVSTFPPSLKVTGMTLTGWSRFDHFGALCELLPASIPSLALCLGVLKEGQLNDRIKKQVSAKLGLYKFWTFEIDVFNFIRYWPENFKFPGHDVYELVGELEKSLGWYSWAKGDYEGWARPYQQQNNRLSFNKINITFQNTDVSINRLRALLPKAKQIISNYFHNETVKEWITDKIDTNIQDITSLKTKIKKILKDGNFP